MSIPWESILPKKIYCERHKLHEEHEPFDCVYGMRSRTLNQCLTALKQAEARGEICKPLSVEAIEEAIIKATRNIANPYCNQTYTLYLSNEEFKRMSEFVHNAMVGKERV